MIIQLPIEADDDGLVLRIPAELAQQMGLSAGGAVSAVGLGADQLLLTAANPKFSAELEAGRTAALEFRNAVRALGK